MDLLSLSVVGRNEMTSQPRIAHKPRTRFRIRHLSISASPFYKNNNMYLLSIPVSKTTIESLHVRWCRSIIVRLGRRRYRTTLSCHPSTSWMSLQWDLHEDHTVLKQSSVPSPKNQWESQALNTYCVDDDNNSTRLKSETANKRSSWRRPNIVPVQLFTSINHNPTKNII